MAKNSKPALLNLEILGIGKGSHAIDAVSKVNIKLEDGSWLGILPGHAPLIAATADCDLKYTRDSEERSVGVKGGILIVRDNSINLLTTY